MSQFAATYLRTSRFKPEFNESSKERIEATPESTKNIFEPLK